MPLPAGVLPDDIKVVLEMFAEMDEDTREAWVKNGATMMELVGKPSKVNPYGKSKRRKVRKPAAKKKSVRSTRR